MRSVLVTIFLIGAFGCAGTTIQPGDLQCSVKPDPRLRNHCVNTTCGPGTSVRGKAFLSRGLKKLELTQGGESDSYIHGAQGYVKYYLKDQTGAVIAYGGSSTRKCPAKDSGAPRICEWPSDSVDIPEYIAKDAATLEVEPVCTDQLFQPLGIKFDAVGSNSLSLIIGHP